MNGATMTKAIAIGTMMALLLTFATPVVAQEEEDFYYRRAIGEQYTSKSAIISSGAVTPQGSDWIVFALDTEGDEEKGLGLGVMYGHGNAAGDADHATATFIAPFCIVEFRDDGDGKYDLRADDVVSVLPLHADMDDHSGYYEQTGESDDTMIWYERPGYKTVTHERTAVKDSIGIVIGAETTDGVFTIRMHVSNSVIFSEEIVLSPYEVKMDFIIQDYPYAENDTILALCNIVASANANWNTGLPEVYDDWRANVAEDGLYFDLGDLSEGVGYFSWLRNATLDGEDTKVEETTLAQFSAFEWTAEKATRIDLKYVAFTYGRAETIVHDPKLGFAFEGIPVELQKLIRGNGGVLLVSLFLFVGMVATARYVRKRSSMPKRVNGMPPAPPTQPPMGQVPPGAPPQMPPPGPPESPPQAGTPPTSPPAPPAEGASTWSPQGPQYGYRPPGQ